MGKEVCQNCGEALPPKRKKFCSDECRMVYRKEKWDGKLKNQILARYRNLKNRRLITSRQYALVKKRIDKLWENGVRAKEEIISRLPRLKLNNDRDNWEWDTSAPDDWDNWHEIVSAFYARLVSDLNNWHEEEEE